METEAIVDGLIEAGFTAIEIPLNSPDPFRSIEIAVKRAPKEVLIGAGTVLSVEDVDRLNSVGGRLMVSPNVDREVIEQRRSHGMVTMPGVFTPTEALAACAAGASALKFFPASVLGPAGINAIRRCCQRTFRSVRSAVCPTRISQPTPRSVSEPSAWAQASTRTAWRPTR
jgi:2-dehydro-3-deoxyphosphogalactonate aldolase